LFPIHESFFDWPVLGGVSLVLFIFVIGFVFYKKEDLTQQPYASLIENYKTKMKNGRIVVRYSGTENLLRIMIEAETSEIANLIAISLANELQVALN